MARVVSAEAGRELLALARDAVLTFVREGRRLSPDRRPPDRRRQAIRQQDVPEASGIFVTIRIDEQLRGCIGFLRDIDDLPLAVVDSAVAAATEDPRFEAISEAELERLAFEISLLSPYVATTPEAIVVGRHGVIVRRGGARGLLLPQVAVEQGWDREQLLAGVCRKAGLDELAWRKPGTELECFTADVLIES